MFYFGVIVNYITTSSSTEIAMSNHAIQTFTASLPPRVNRLLLLAIALLGTGATIVAVSPGTTAIAARANAQIAVSAPVVAPLTKIDTAPTLLPTVIVTPDREMTTLATITVRPDHPPTAATPTRADDFALDANSDAQDLRASTSPTTGGGFAMPYYSFSRSPRHANKE